MQRLRFALTLALAYASGPTLLGNQVDFGPARPFAGAAQFGNAMEVGDLDGDGDPDLVCSNGIYDARLSWFENEDGAGGFGLRRPILGPDDLESSPVHLVLADIDGDGDLDVLHDLPAQAGIRGVENLDGEARFWSHEVLVTGLGTLYGIAVADLDDDGHLDLLTTSGPPVDVQWFPGLGGGAFGAGIPVTGASGRTVGASDVDGDGDLDLLAGADWFENLDGAGTLGSPLAISAELTWDMTLEDLDGDGDLDAVETTFDTMSWYENTDGLGTFGPPTLVTSDLFVGRMTRAADMDGDGDRDLVLTQSGETQIEWFENTDGLGAFGPTQPLATTIGPGKAGHPVDIDGDGDLDVAWMGLSPGSAGWIENSDGLGTFAPPEIVAPDADPTFEVLLADVDVDGDPDPVASTARGLWWYENDGAGRGLRPHQLLEVSPADHDMADMDGDGDADLVVASNVFVRWYPNDGRGLFGAAHTIAFQALADQVVRVVVLDVDADGDRDAVLVTQKEELAWVENLDGLGTFGAVQSIVGAQPDFWSGLDLDAGDFQLDGFPDLVRVSDRQESVDWFPNDTGVGFTGPLPIAHPVSPNQVEAADLDGDGRPDVLGAFRDGAGLRWARNLGGAFAPLFELPLTAASYQTRVHAVDLDGDADLDLVLHGRNITGPLTGGTFGIDNQQLGWLENDGAGAFASTRVFADRAPAVSITAGDLDGDGDADVVVGEESWGNQGDQLTWFENRGPWRSLGGAVAGAWDEPELLGEGSLAGGTTVDLLLTRGAPGASAFMVLGPVALEAPYKGGTLVPLPVIVIGGLPVDADGLLPAPFAMPPGTPSGAAAYIQFWIVDAQAPFGLSASNGLVGVTP